MADGDGGVLVEQQQGHRLADDIAAAHHHGAFPGDGYPVPLQQFQNARRGAGARSGQRGHQVAHIAGMEAVHVFAGDDRQQDALGIHLRGRGTCTRMPSMSGRWLRPRTMASSSPVEIVPGAVALDADHAAGRLPARGDRHQLQRGAHRSDGDRPPSPRQWLCARPS